MRNNSNAKTGDGVHLKRIDGRACKFYLIHPPENADANLIAKQLMCIKDVEEVFVTDGDYGFVVRAKCDAHGQDDAFDYLSKKLSGNFEKATSYYQYKK